MSDQDRLLEAQKLFQTVRSDAEMQDVSQMTPCGKPCIQLILHDQALRSINKRLEAGDRALDAIPMLVEEMKAIRVNVEATKGVVEAWGNIKGFAKFMQSVSVTLKVATPIVLFFGFFYLLFYNPQLAFEKARLWLGAK